MRWGFRRASRGGGGRGAVPILHPNQGLIEEDPGPEPRTGNSPQRPSFQRPANPRGWKGPRRGARHWPSLTPVLVDGVGVRL